MSDLRMHLMDIYRQRGQLVPDEVHDIVADPSHPLHSRYEWDDSIAGRKYRNSQIAADIRTVKVEYTSTSSGERKFVRGFYSLHQSGDARRNGYAPIEEVVQDDFSLKILLRQLEREIADLKRRFGHLSEFAEIMRQATA